MDEPVTRSEILKLNEAVRIELRAFIDEKTSNLATKDDVKDIVNLMKNLKIGIGVAEISWKYLAEFGKVAAAIASIALIIKFGLADIIHWALSEK